MDLKKRCDLIVSQSNWNILKKKLVDKSGIYAVYTNGKCLYVGKSINLKHRVRRIYDSIHLNYTCIDTNWMLKVVLAHLFLIRAEVLTRMYFHSKKDIDKYELEAEYFMELNPSLNGNNVNRKGEVCSYPWNKEQRKSKTRKIYNKTLEA